jgi:hypothetical protein
MPASYSYDLRVKVIEAIDGGMGKTQVSKIFNISRNTINLWLNQRKKTGDYRAKKGYQQGYGAKITGNCSPQLRYGIANGATNGDGDTRAFCRSEKFPKLKIEAKVKIAVFRSLKLTSVEL